MQVRRLKTREQFQAVLACPPCARTEHFVMHRLAASTAGIVSTTPPDFPAEKLWVGAMVPKRWARRAVTRNLIRRLIHGLAQHHAAELPHAAYLLRLRAGFDRLKFHSASSDVLRAAVRAELELLFRKVVRVAPGSA